MGKEDGSVAKRLEISKRTEWSGGGPAAGCILLVLMVSWDHRWLSDFFLLNIQLKSSAREQSMVQEEPLAALPVSPFWERAPLREGWVIRENEAISVIAYFFVYWNIVYPKNKYPFSLLLIASRYKGSIQWSHMSRLGRIWISSILNSPGSLGSHSEQNRCLFINKYSLWWDVLICWEAK